MDQHHQQPRPLGNAQHSLRQAEQFLRQRATRMISTHQPAVSVAQALQLSPRTLNSWQKRSEEVVSRGRPATPVDPLVKLRVDEVLSSLGRSIGVPALKRLFHDVPRSTLHELRQQRTSEERHSLSHLHWQLPGTVWSIDYTEPPMPIDGVFNQVLVVRDLASQYTLLAMPGQSQSSEDVVHHLRQLFIQHTPPLVLKSDNGGPFIAGMTRQLCVSHGVQNLLSPPITPQYNGSVEATGGQLKTRAACIAARQSCSFWTSDILEAARLSANALNRPWGPAAPTPMTRWQERAAIEPSRRKQFAELIQFNIVSITRGMQRQREERGLDSTMTAACIAIVARTAIRQALLELGLLQIRRPNLSTELGGISGRN